jgi:glycosyltransferase involved in cell wall biosynthesis
MDIMLHTSRIGECNSVAINEWLFFWLPIITKSTDFTKYTIFDRDNWQIEIVQDWINGYIENDLNIIADKIILLYKDRNLLKNISKNNIDYAINLFNATDLTKKLEDLFECNSVQNIQFNINDYKNKTKKETIYSLITENLKAIIDKFIFKA